MFNKITEYTMENNDLEYKPEAKICSERILMQHINHAYLNYVDLLMRKQKWNL